MTFSNIASGAAVFVDANTLTYHFEPHAILGPPCTDLLERIRQGHLAGFTSTHVLSEVAHRLMTLEAIKLFGWPFAGIAQRLNQHPSEVQKLTLFRQALEKISQGSLQVLTVSMTLLLDAANISQQTGVLHNDALIVAIMRHHGLTNLASNDTDFDRVPGLTRYAPA